MEEIISLIEEKIAGNIRKGGGSVNYSWEEIISLIEENVAGDRISTPSGKIFSSSYKKLSPVVCKNIFSEEISTFEKIITNEQISLVPRFSTSYNVHPPTMR